MNKRQRKKRKKEQYLLGLERGNRYLQEVIGRLLAEKSRAAAQLQGVEAVYQSYLLALCGGGQRFIPFAEAERLAAGFMLAVERQEDGIWLRTQERQ